MRWLKKGDSNWLIQRCIVDRLFVIFYNERDSMLDYVELVTELLTMQEFRGYDAHLLSRFNSVLNPFRSKLPSQTDINAAYPRYIFLSLLAFFLSQLTHQQKDLQFLHFLMDLNIRLLRLNLHKSLNQMQLPYCQAHRTKIHIWHSLLVLKPLYSFLKDHNYISQTMSLLHQLMQQNNLSTIRQYIDIYSINLIIQYPEPNI